MTQIKFSFFFVSWGLSNLGRKLHMAFFTFYQWENIMLMDELTGNKSGALCIREMYDQDGLQGPTKIAKAHWRSVRPFFPLALPLGDFMNAHTSFIIYGLILYKRSLQTLSSLEVWTMQLAVQWTPDPECPLETEGSLCLKLSLMFSAQSCSIPPSSLSHFLESLLLAQARIPGSDTLPLFLHIRLVESLCTQWGPCFAISGGGFSPHCHSLCFSYMTSHYTGLSYQGDRRPVSASFTPARGTTVKILFIVLTTRNLHCQWTAQSLSMASRALPGLTWPRFPLYHHKVCPSPGSFLQLTTWHGSSLCAPKQHRCHVLWKSLPTPRSGCVFPDGFTALLYLPYHHNNLLLLWEQGTAIVLHALRQYSI